MHWIDTHTHLYSEEFDTDRTAMVERAVALGVDKLLLPNIDENSIDAMLRLEAEFPGQVYAMMGIHPCYVTREVDVQLALVRSWFEKRSFVGVGEIGLDFYWDKSLLDQQYKAFREQLKLAREYKLPVSIHSREATREAIDEVRQLQDGNLSGVFHCFSGTLEEAREVIDLGFYLGIGGVVTFKKAGLDKLLEAIDLKHVVLETDSPYLAPVPFRGKRNESSYIPLIGEKIANIKNLKIEEVAVITSSNAGKLFKTL
ncbi:TatD DNase family protein [Chitinophaga terrae (ex Kim and Jung 2007)]|uniref:TatD DNase family protein n=1 Tax=Chitinophaga terrae (ex Kim and Jung 2007) TaxID=408074 RepID=A0A1H4CR94_9BACT|nr:TatD family hydrolase [Chitinophaga terrae (ex Kim and Jung 2007)]GEP90404.1 TatD family hydrolase [Chitinophaga terrae (ex Kim and Jung 2007)]SEA62877.1 TatD DNase family protein [Chitinophaga terrae (ex Kim and Jung 2007)]